MKNSIKDELKQHLVESVEDGVLRLDNKDEWHHISFNESYYIIGYFQCNEWLKEHKIDPFEAIKICNDYELENFGEISSRYENSEKVVNMLVYIYGEEVIYTYEKELLELLEV